MNNTSPNHDITLNLEGMNPNIYAVNDNQKYIPAEMPNLAGNNAVVYPEIYYKLQPHVMMICDQMDAYGMLPTKDNMDHASKQLHENVLANHPEMAEFDKDNDNMMPEARQAIIADYGFRGYDDYGFRRGRGRGVLRDILDILLLSEFHRRRRRFYY